MVAESMDLDSSVKTEILTLLHQRVDNRSTYLFVTKNSSEDYHGRLVCSCISDSLQFHVYFKYAEWERTWGETGDWDSPLPQNKITLLVGEKLCRIM